MSAGQGPRLWPPEEVFRVAGENLFIFRPVGVFNLGANLQRLEWALATVSRATELATFVVPFRTLTEVKGFQDIGTEAVNWHNYLSNLPNQTSPSLPNVLGTLNLLGQIVPDATVPDTTKNQLRDSRTRWETLARERLGDLYLITPTSQFDVKKLMGGIQSFLEEADMAILEPMERSDLKDACQCILVGSPTPAEFVALRAAEGLLRRWYERKTGNKIEHKAWGYVLDLLQKEYPPGPKRPKELDLLDYLNARRNEVGHPERISSPMEAERTLMSVCSLITGVRAAWSTLSLFQTPWGSPEPASQ